MRIQALKNGGYISWDFEMLAQAETPVLAPQGVCNIDFYAKMPVGDGLVSWMAELRRRRRWKWSTTARNMAALAGALSLLPAYRRTPTTIRLTDDAIWKLATRAVAKKQYQELPRQAHAASYDDIRRCVSTTKCLPTRVALILSWAFCGRVGDVLRLKKDELTVRPNPTTGFTEVTVRFTRAKTTPQRGPYTLHTAISQAWGELLVRWMAERRTWLFPREVTTGSITAALRQVRPELECRSIRRGSLQTMASAGVPEATLLEFSAHTTVAMLRRYLGWGAIGSLRKEQMTTAALTLARVARV